MDCVLIIRPFEAKLTQTTDFFFKMNPYCQFKIGQEKTRSQAHKKGGKAPQWTNTLNLMRDTNEDLLTISVKDQNLLSRNRVIGKGVLNLKDIPTFIPTSQWVPLFSKGKPIGDLLVEVTVAPNHVIETNRKGSNSVSKVLSSKFSFNTADTDHL